MRPVNDTPDKKRYSEILKVYKCNKDHRVLYNPLVKKRTMPLGFIYSEIIKSKNEALAAELPMATKLT